MSETTQHRITLPIPHAWEVTYGDAVKSRCFKLEHAEAEKAAIALHGTVERLYTEQQVLQMIAAASTQQADCGNEDCGWDGPISETCMLGDIGPLCPQCREVVEPVAEPAQNNFSQPPLSGQQTIAQAANALVAEATRLGVSFTVTHKPLQPLSMGHYSHVVDVWEARCHRAPVLTHAEDSSC